MQAAVGTANTVEDDEDDCMRIWDWSQAFLQALEFDEDMPPNLPPKFVSYTGPTRGPS